MRIEDETLSASVYFEEDRGGNTTVGYSATVAPGAGPTTVSSAAP